MRDKWLSYMVIAIAAVVLVALFARAGAADAESWHPRLAPIMEQVGYGTLETSADVDTWKVFGYEPGNSAYVVIETGTGPLCGCPHGEPFPPAVAIWGMDGSLVVAVVSELGVAAVSLDIDVPSEPFFVELTSAVPTDQDHKYTVTIY